MRDRYFGLMVLIEFGVQVNIIDTVFRKYPLSSVVLTLNTDHGSSDLVSGEVTDQSGKVRNPSKQVRHSAALKVNDKEADIFRAVIDRQ